MQVECFRSPPYVRLLLARKQLLLYRHRPVSLLLLHARLHSCFPKAVLRPHVPPEAAFDLHTCAPLRQVFFPTPMLPQHFREPGR